MQHLKPFIQFNVKQGAGCSAAGRMKLEASRQRAQELKQRFWEASPERQAALAEESKRAQEAFEAQAKEQEAKAEALGAWSSKFDALKANPPIGSVIEGSNAVFRLQQDPRNGNLVVYGLIRVIADFPVEPTRQLAQTGKSGLKVFLNRDGRDRLERLNISEFDICRGDPTHVGSVWLRDAKVRIIGHAKSGKSVHGELL